MIEINKRSRLQLFLDVLKVINEGEYRPTRIMYRSNLSWNPLNKILKQMISLKLIKKYENGNRRLFMITERGERLLDKIDEIKEILCPSIHRASYNLDTILHNSSIRKEMHL